jgi:hypothetical protein
MLSRSDGFGIILDPSIFTCFYEAILNTSYTVHYNHWTSKVISDQLIQYEALRRDLLNEKCKYKNNDLLSNTRGIG